NPGPPPPPGPATGAVSITTVGVNAINLDGGTLVAGTAPLLTAGGLNLTSGTLSTTVTGGVLVTSPITLNNASVTLAGSSPLLLGGSIALLGANNILSVSNSAATVLSGIMSGSGNLIVGSGAGTLIVSGTNTYTGTTTVNLGGIVQAQNAQAFGTGVGAIVSVASGASLKLLGAFTMANAIVLNGTGTGTAGAIENMIGGNNTLSGPVTLLGNTTLGADGNSTLTVNGAIGGGFNLGKVGVGTLVLASALSNYTGSTTISTGVLNITNGNALGAITGSVSVTSGATLQLQGGITVAGKALTLNGTGYGNSGALPQGALVNQAGNNIWAGSVAVSGAAVLTAGTIPLLGAANTGTLIGGVTGTILTVTGVVSGTDLVKVGAATVVLNNADTYTGQTVVLGGALTLGNTNAATGLT